MCRRPSDAQLAASDPRAYLAAQIRRVEAHLRQQLVPRVAQLLRRNKPQPDPVRYALAAQLEDELKQLDRAVLRYLPQEQVQPRQ